MSIANYIKIAALFLCFLSLENLSGQNLIEPRREFRSEDTKTMGISSDGHWLLLSARENITIFHTRTGLQIRQFSGHTNRVTSIATNPRKRVAVSGDENGNIILWNIDDLSVVQKYDVQKGAVKNLRFSKDGLNFTAVVGGKNTLSLFDLTQASPLARTEKGLTEVNALEIMEDRTSVATAHDNGTIATWSALDSFKTAKYLKVHEGRVTGIRVTKTGMVTASDDKMLRIWAADGKMKKSYIMEAAIRSLDLSVDQKTAVLSLDSGKTIVVELATGMVKFTFQTKAEVKNTICHPTEPVIVSLYSDSKARSWILR
jgi:WD40 repeat protein